MEKTINPQRCEISQLLRGVALLRYIIPCSSLWTTQRCWISQRCGFMQFSELKEWPVCLCWLLLCSPKYWLTKLSQDKFRKLIGTLEQTIDIIRHNSIRCSSCVKLKNIGKSFMMLLLKMDLSAALGFMFDDCDLKSTQIFPNKLML